MEFRWIEKNMKYLRLIVNVAYVAMFVWVGKESIQQNHSVLIGLVFTACIIVATFLVRFVVSWIITD